MKTITIEELEALKDAEKTIVDILFLFQAEDGILDAEL